MQMHFAGWRHTLGDYITAIGACGLAVVGLAEPTPITSDVRLATGRWGRLPLFCWFTLRHSVRT